MYVLIFVYVCYQRICIHMLNVAIDAIKRNLAKHALLSSGSPYHCSNTNLCICIYIYAAYRSEVALV